MITAAKESTVHEDGLPSMIVYPARALKMSRVGAFCEVLAAQARVRQGST
ncbi:hypothetical protein [Streptomyces sp. NPDC056069]